jgi:phosphate transport system substrate-binding protein
MHLDLLFRIAALSLAALHVAGAHGQSSEKIVIDGSTGVMPLAAALAKAFQTRSPGVGVDLGGGLGTKARIEALAEGKIDIALASHGLDIAAISRQGMSAHEVARTAVVFAVNAGVPISNLTAQQICDVYSGQTSNWKSLGGPDLAIAARTRPDSEVDAEVVRAGIGCLKSLRKPDAVKVMPRAGDMAKELAATPGAIGMTSMTVVEQSQGRVRFLTIDGVPPSADNVERKRYGLVREAFFVTKSPPPPAVGRFLEFARSAEGSEVIRANGAIPVK